MLGVLVPVGPGAEELRRLDDLVDSLEHHEPASRLRLVLVDDAPWDRQLPERYPGAVVLRTPLWDGDRPPHRYDAILAGVLHGLRAAARLQPEMVVKIDTDALVVGPFVDVLRRALAADPEVGMFGSYERTSTGAPREWDAWGRRIRKAAWRRRDRRRLLRAARAHGYEPGAHCLGGALAVTPAFLAAAQDARWDAFCGTGLPDDVVLGLLCRSAGLQMRGLVGPGEPFALAFQGLPAPPDELVARGHGIVHSVKDHGAQREADVRAAFRALRETPPRYRTIGR